MFLNFLMCAWVCACEFLLLGATKAQNMVGRFPSLIPLSAVPPLTSTLVGPFSHSADISAVLLLHCQGANKPWKVSIWRSSDQGLARTWKLSYMCVLGARLAQSTVRDGSPTTLWGESDGGPNGSTHSGSQRSTLCADVSNALATASRVLIQTCESDTN